MSGIGSRLLEPVERHPVLRTGLIVLGGFLVTLLAGYVIAQVLVGEPHRSERVQIGKLDAIEPGSVLRDDSAELAKLEDEVGMAVRTAGVALVAEGEVARVRTGSGLRRAPVGSRLVAFTLGDWPCAAPPCDPWTALEPLLSIDGTEQELPTGGDTFVAVLPPGTEDVELVIDADGFTQRINVLEESVDIDNIAFLAGRDRDHHVVVDKTVRVSEHTSIPLDDGTGQVRDLFERDVTVADLDRRFYIGEVTPNSPREVFLIVNATYNYVGQSGRYLVPETELRFVDSNGVRYRPTDLDPAEDKVLLAFEIPASIVKGALLIGGTTQKASTTGTPYTSTLLPARLPVRFGG